MAGDVLHVGSTGGDWAGDSAAGASEPRAIPDDLLPAIGDEWELGVLYGPHGAPDFFTDDDIVEFFAATWEVHYNSSRTGVRLLGSKPKWARSDGGEAGLHPSNIHDNAYAVGTVDFTGDMPVILGPDGPSLGGFVCPVTLVKSELWKLGQLRANNRVRFKRLSAEEALRAELAQEEMLATLRKPEDSSVHSRPARGRTLSGTPPQRGADADTPILASIPARDTRPAVVYRRAGDKYVLVEYGPLILDLELRLRVHALMSWLQAAALPGIVDLTPGIRSLQVHYDSRLLPLERLLDQLSTGEQSLAAIDDMQIPTRIVRLPLSWDDESTQLAIAKYMQSVRADAPWCPSNIEFIRRGNGLDSVADVKPWLLRCFDQIRFYQVSGAELREFREDFLHGRARLDIADDTFRLKEYRRFLAENSPSIALQKARQQVAFESERRRWEATGQIGYAADLPEAHDDESPEELQPGCVAVVSPVSGSVWKISSAPGQAVKAGDTLVLVESMKMELPVTAPMDGIVTQLRCTEGRAVLIAQTLVVMRPHEQRAVA